VVDRNQDLDVQDLSPGDSFTAPLNSPEIHLVKAVDVPVRHRINLVSNMFEFRSHGHFELLPELLRIVDPLNGQSRNIDLEPQSVSPDIPQTSERASCPRCVAAEGEAIQ
jgi:hypothetical protein